MNANSTIASNQPPIWNPNSIASWSLLFSPIFGAWLTYLNWQGLGEKDRAVTSRYWLAAFIIWMVATAAIVIVAYDPMYRMGVVVAYILMFLAWYLVENRTQNNFIKRKFRGKYLKRAWLKPLTVALSVYLVLQLALFGVASRVSTDPKCSYTHTVGGLADYRTETWGVCW